MGYQQLNLSLSQRCSHEHYYLNGLLSSVIKNNPDPDVIKRLVEFGADLNAKDGEDNLLLQAIQCRADLSIIKCLVDL